MLTCRYVRCGNTQLLTYIYVVCTYMRERATMLSGSRHRHRSGHTAIPTLLLSLTASRIKQIFKTAAYFRTFVCMKNVELIAWTRNPYRNGGNGSFYARKICFKTRYCAKRKSKKCKSCINFFLESQNEETLIIIKILLVTEKKNSYF